MNGGSPYVVNITLITITFPSTTIAQVSVIGEAEPVDLDLNLILIKYN